MKKLNFNDIYSISGGIGPNDRKKSNGSPRFFIAKNGATVFPQRDGSLFVPGVPIPLPSRYQDDSCLDISKNKIISILYTDKSSKDDSMPEELICRPRYFPPTFNSISGL